jgi:RNA polymerase sigma-70 factor (ECF subfamily)
MDASPVADAAPPFLTPSEGPAALDSTSDDAELLAAMALGLNALDILYDRYRTIAYSVAYRITNDPSLAEDVVQEAFLGVWRHAARYRSHRGSVKTWVMSIVHHRAIDAVRRRKPVSELPPIELEPPVQLRVPDVWAAVSADLDAVEVHRAMSVLSPVQRQAIELAYFGGLTQQEIADRTDTPLGTIKSRIRLGLLAMRGSLVAEQAEAVVGG